MVPTARRPATDLTGATRCNAQSISLTRGRGARRRPGVMGYVLVGRGGGVPTTARCCPLKPPATRAWRARASGDVEALYRGHYRSQSGDADGGEHGDARH